MCLIQAINAAPYGVIGVLVYTDPLDINDGLMSDVNETYPHSWYLPPSGVERGSFNTHYGDMLTPYLAAKGKHCSHGSHVVVFLLFMACLLNYCCTLAPIVSKGRLLQQLHTSQTYI